MRRFLHIFGLLAFWLLVLTAGHLSSTMPWEGKTGEWVRMVAFEIKHPENQWIVWLFFLIYLLTFLWLQAGRGWRSFRVAGQRACLITGLAIIGGLWYWSQYPEASARLDALVWITGILCGQAVAFVAGDSRKARSTVLLTLAFAVALLACWHPETIRDYEYRGQDRWSGIWENPNRYGLLMALGCLLVLARCGDLVVRLRRSKPFGWRIGAEGTLLVAVLAIFATGLLQSYSRGAWLGLGIGLLFVVWKRGSSAGFSQAAEAGDGHGISRNETPAAFLNRFPASFVGRHALPLIAIVLATGVLGFWTFRHSETTPIRRAFSVANANDFSWRNRVEAYEGALRMMSDRPLTGYGWNRPPSYYPAFHASPRLEETVAITLNDILAIATTLGLPAFAMFGGLVFLSFRGPPLEDGKVPDTEASIDWTVIACRGGVIVLLVGFWFGNGLFYLALGGPFWVLLEFARRGGESSEHPLAPALAPERAEGEDTRDASGNTDPHSSAAADSASGRQPFFAHARQPRWAFAGFLLVAFLCALWWANARAPFQLRYFSLKAESYKPASGVAVVPKSAERCPVILYLHGANGTILKDGKSLRQFAELGFATVSIDYDQTNEVAFAAQFQALHDYVRRQDWADPERIAWIGMSRGAQRTLSFALTHAEPRPDLYVRMAGGWVGELGPRTDEPKHQNADGNDYRLPPVSEIAEQSLAVRSVKDFDFPVLLVHGQFDRIFPVTDARRLESLLRSNAVPVDTRILDGQNHGFRPNREVVVRAIGEYCAEFFNTGKAVPTNRIPSCWYCWIPVALMIGGALGYGVKRLRQRSRSTEAPSPKAAPILKVAAWILAIAAILQTVFHLSLPRMKATEGVLRSASRWLVWDRIQDDFDYLASLAIWKEEPLSTVLTHADLANYRGHPFLYKELDPEIWQRYVVSPEIDDTSLEELDWRRPLWENFYPRVRKKKTPEEASEIVARFLRERVGIHPDYAANQGIRTAWEKQFTDERGWERLYAAALRSATVAARLDPDGKVEIWTGSR